MALRHGRMTSMRARTAREEYSEVQKRTFSKWVNLKLRYNGNYTRPLHGSASAPGHYKLILRTRRRWRWRRAARVGLCMRSLVSQRMLRPPASIPALPLDHPVRRCASSVHRAPAVPPVGLDSQISPPVLGGVRL